LNAIEAMPPATQDEATLPTEGADSRILNEMTETLRHQQLRYGQLAGFEVCQVSRIASR